MKSDGHNKFAGRRYMLAFSIVHCTFFLASNIVFTSIFIVQANCSFYLFIDKITGMAGNLSIIIVLYISSLICSIQSILDYKNWDNICIDYKKKHILRINENFTIHGANDINTLFTWQLISLLFSILYNSILIYKLL